MVVSYRSLAPQTRFRVFTRWTTFVYVRKGCKQLFAADADHVAQTGDFVLMLPGAHLMSETRSKSGAYESTMVCFSERFLGNLRSEHPRWFGPRARRSASPRGISEFVTHRGTPYLRDLVGGLRRSLNSATSADMVTLKLTELCLSLRDTDARGALNEAIRRATTDGDQRLRSVVEQHRLDTLSLNELASLSARSLSAFKRDFQREYGEPPGRWLRKCRLDNARVLLQTTDTSVTEVCHRSGFGDLSSFIRLFRRMYGTTPKQFQARSQAV